MNPLRTPLLILLAATLGCDGGTIPFTDADRGPVEATVSEAGRTAWPGLDRADTREINTVDGFFNGIVTRYWFLGFASKRTADSFWFCREGDSLCPLDENRRLNWDRLVGNPIFAKLPGMEGFSPFWQMWVVHVPDSYEPNQVKSLGTLDSMAAVGKVKVEPFILDFGTLLGEYVGPEEAVLHCALVLDGTTLKHNGDPYKPDPTLQSKILEVRKGWHEGLRVQFFDFSFSDGVFPAARDSEGRALMPTAKIFVTFRNCQTDPEPGICKISGYPSGATWRPVTERGLGKDITGDGDLEDSNTLIPVIPCKRPDIRDLRYSPLWQPHKMRLLRGMDPLYDLVDTMRNDSKSDLKSMVDARSMENQGIFLPFEPLREDETGNPVPGNDGALLFNCPVQVADDFVPHPCQE